MATATSHERAASSRGARSDECWIEITDRELPLAQTLDWATRPSAGAVALFCGVIRDHSPGRPGVASVAYEAYHEKAEARLHEIAQMARAQFPDLGCVGLLHRVGELGVGEIALLAVVSSAHRAVAFDGLRYLVEALKRSVPIWKKETWEGGTDWGLDAEPIVPVGETRGLAGRPIPDGSSQ